MLNIYIKRYIYIILCLNVLFNISCGSVKQNQHIIPNKKNPVKINYLNYNIAIEKYKDLQKNTQITEVQKHVEATWLLQNIAVSINKLKEIDKNILITTLNDTDYIPYKYRAEITTAMENFKLLLPPKHSFRIPVSSFCLQESAHPPSNNIRYKNTSLLAESLSKQILFHFLKSKTNDIDFQSLMWSLENKNTAINNLNGFSEILNFLGFTYDKVSSLNDFEKAPSTIEYAKKLNINQESNNKQLDISLISQGYSAGELIIRNTSEIDDVTINPDNLIQRFVPDRNLNNLNENYFATVQPIFASGPRLGSASIVSLQKAQKSLKQSIELDKQINEILSSTGLTEKEKKFIEQTRLWISELQAQGEFEEANKFCTKLTEILPKLIENGADWGTTLTPGVNDLRDLYEFISGQNLITGEKLSVFERSLSGAGLIIGSGVAYRKSLDTLLILIKNDSPELLKNSEKILTFVEKYKIKTPEGANVLSRIDEALDSLPTHFKINRIKEGKDPTKIAIIGRSMVGVVNDTATHLGNKGIKPKTFAWSDVATTNWQKVLKKYRDKIGNQTARLPFDEVKQTIGYAENKLWAENLINEGYTIIDMGDPLSKDAVEGISAFYEIEKEIIFGAKL